MIMIRRAGHESATFCRSFFRPEESQPPSLHEELTGLAASFHALEAYPPCQAPDGQDPSHG